MEEPKSHETWSPPSWISSNLVSLPAGEGLRVPPETSQVPPVVQVPLVQKHCCWQFRATLMRGLYPN